MWMAPKLNLKNKVRQVQITGNHLRSVFWAGGEVLDKNDPNKFRYPSYVQVVFNETLGSLNFYIGWW